MDTSLSLNRLVHGVASSMGAAHYDDFTRVELDWYGKLAAFGSPVLAVIVYDLALAALALGKVVVATTGD